MSLAPPSKIDPKKIFIHGDKFYWVVENLLKIGIEEQFKKTAYPAMTLSAFTSELFMKSLVCFETGKVPHGQI